MLRRFAILLLAPYLIFDGSKFTSQKPQSDIFNSTFLFNRQALALAGGSDLDSHARLVQMHVIKHSNVLNVKKLTSTWLISLYPTLTRTQEIILAILRFFEISEQDLILEVGDRGSIPGCFYPYHLILHASLERNAVSNPSRHLVGSVANLPRHLADFSKARSLQLPRAILSYPPEKASFPIEWITAIHESLDPDGLWVVMGAPKALNDLIRQVIGLKLSYVEAHRFQLPENEEGALVFVKADGLATLNWRTALSLAYSADLQSRLLSKRPLMIFAQKDQFPQVGYRIPNTINLNGEGLHALVREFPSEGRILMKRNLLDGFDFRITDPTREQTWLQMGFASRFYGIPEIPFLVTLKNGSINSEILDSQHRDSGHPGIFSSKTSRILKNFIQWLAKLPWDQRVEFVINKVAGTTVSFLTSLDMKPDRHHPGRWFRTIYPPDVRESA